MSGSPRIPVPSAFELSVKIANSMNTVTNPHDREKRAAAVLMLHALYREFPLSAEQHQAQLNRELLIKFADRGWFMLLTKDTYLDYTNVPPDRVRSAILLLLD